MQTNNYIGTSLLESPYFPLLLLLVIILAVELGWKFGQYLRLKGYSQKVDVGATFLASIYGLLALILALTFTGASDRFDKRRDLIIKEVTTIGTAYQYVDLLNPSSQVPVRDLFKSYLDTRIAVYQNTGFQDQMEERFRRHNDVGSRLWRSLVHAVEEVRFPDKLVAAQILTATSDMFDASENQRLSIKLHPPHVIFLTLLLITLAGSLVAGYNLGLAGEKDFVHTIVFSSLMTGIIVIILNLEYPHVGLIGVHEFGRELISLRQQM